MAASKSVAVAMAAALALSGCQAGAGDKGGGGGEGEPGGPAGPPAAGGKPILSAPAAIGNGKARIDLLWLSRGANNSATVRLDVVNVGPEALNVGDMFTDLKRQKYEANGVTFVDAQAGKRYYPLHTTDGKCLCTNTDVDVDPGKSLQVYATLPAPPANVKRIMLALPMAGAFPDIPINDGPAPALPNGSIDAAKAQLQPPRILPLISTVEGDGKAVDDDGADEKVRLSSDVLFALNKANLSARARSVLTEVAKRIDQSPGKTVKVDGHTDTTGNDAINEPLSQRRAQAVEQQLKTLVTRQGVTYRSAGHGSKEPIARNDTDQGRQRNRRVTVSFAKPVPPKPPAPPAASAPPAPGAPQQVIATAQPKDADVQNVKLEITSFRRDSAGLVTMVWRQTNTGGEQFYAGTKFFDPITRVYYFEHSGTHGVTLHDEANALRYYTLRDQSTVCVCSGLTSYSSKIYIRQNESGHYFNVFKLPPDVKSIDVEIPGYQVAKNVQIS